MSEQERAIEMQGECRCTYIFDNVYEGERGVVYCINCAKPVSVDVARAVQQDSEE